MSVTIEDAQRVACIMRETVWNKYVRLMQAHPKSKRLYAVCKGWLQDSAPTEVISVHHSLELAKKVAQKALEAQP